MELIENIVDYFKKPPAQTKNTSPEGTCPVCWGYQSYDAKIRKLYKDKQIDVNNHKASYTIIKKFVIEHLDGIRLKKGEVRECPTCSDIKKHKTPNPDF